MIEAVVRERRLRWPIDKQFEAAVRGQTIRRIERRAKYILIGFDSGTAIVHLGMSGSLRMLPSGTPPRAHDHWDLVLDTGRVLRFHDPRRFGSLHWVVAMRWHIRCSQSSGPSRCRRTSMRGICTAPRASAPWP